MEKPNLVWETIGYEPIILFSLEPVVRHIRSSLSHDMSHFYYFMESQRGLTDVRDSDFTSCKSLLKSQLDDPGLFFYRTKDVEFTPSGFMSKFKSFDYNT